MFCPLMDIRQGEKFLKIEKAFSSAVVPLQQAVPDQVGFFSLQIGTAARSFGLEPGVIPGGNPGQ